MEEQVSSEQIMDRMVADYDKYKVTVDFLSALKYYFVNKLTGHTTIYIGREMQASTSGTCKPDLISEKNNTALVCEIKAGMPRNLGYFVKKDMVQLKSFDNISSGWSGQNITTKEISLFILSKFQKSFMDFLKQSTTDFKTFRFSINVDGNVEQIDVTLENNFLIWFFSIDESGSTPCFNIFKAIGDSIDTEFNSKATENILIPLQEILQDLSDFRFYDAQPPDAYLLEIIWSHIINTMFEKQEYIAKNKSGLRVLSVKVSADYILSKTEKVFITDLDSTKGTKSIRKRMMQRFIDLLCDLEMAKQEEDGTYTIFYKEVPNAKQYFLEELTKLAVKKNIYAGVQTEILEWFDASPATAPKTTESHSAALEGQSHIKRIGESVI